VREQIKERLVEQNPHWTSGYFYESGIKRDVYMDIKANLHDKLILVLYGPRRVGKTTLLRQIINDLISAVERHRILYMSLDAYRFDLIEALRAYRELFSLDLHQGSFFVFIDEIQKREEWDEELKYLYDTFSNVHFVVSGSSSLGLKKGKQTLAGRTKTFLIKPLSFLEYLRFTGKTATTSVFNTYLLRQLPYLALYDIDPKEYIQDLVQKAIFGDLVDTYQIKEPEIVERIFRLIAKAPGQILRLTDISQEFGINRNTISRYLRYLEETLLIRKVYNYSRNIRKSEIKSKKYYPFYPTLSAYVLPYLPALGYLYETEAALKLDAEYFWRERNKEIDFIIGEDLDVGVEVKAGRRLQRKACKGFWSCPLSLRRRIIVHAPDSEILERCESIEYLPITEIESILKERQ